MQNYCEVSSKYFIACEYEVEGVLLKKSQADSLTFISLNIKALIT